MSGTNYQGADVVLKQGKADIGRIKSVKSAGTFETKMVACSLLGDSHPTFIAARCHEPVKYSFTLAFDTGDASYTGLSSLWNNGTAGTFAFTLGAAFESFDAFVTKLE